MLENGCSGMKKKNVEEATHINQQTFQTSKTPSLFIQEDFIARVSHVITIIFNLYRVILPLPFILGDTVQGCNARASDVAPCSVACPSGTKSTPPSGWPHLCIELHGLVALLSVGLSVELGSADQRTPLPGWTHASIRLLSMLPTSV